MAVSSAQKQTRTALRREGRNKSVRSVIKAQVTKARNAIAGGDAEKAQKGVVAAIRALDKATTKGVMHRKTAARRKSRLMKRLNASQAKVAAPAPAPAAK